MKKIIFCLSVLFLPPNSSSHPAKSTQAPATITYFFPYNYLWEVEYVTALPPTTLPTVPIGPYERPYYAEYTAYHLDTSVSPWRYYPDGYFLQSYWGPYEY
ncbi:hypothetical protein SAMN05216436_13012 [bacterium A37T11]|nr:hypothetical protein SAMN05216436_13012 [bacterium A37T11]